MSLELVPFSDEHVEGAGRLLAARHARQRAAEPLLPARFEDPAAARDEVAAAWAAEDASGAAALHDGRLTGFVVGSPRDSDVWGPNIWVSVAGHAVERADDARDLYAVAAARWVEEGRTRHYAVVPASDGELVDAWFRLSFGQQQALGIRDVPTDVHVDVPDGVEIREPREHDIESLLPLDVALPAHQRESPIFSQRPLPSEDAIRAEWRRTLAGHDEQVLVGFLHGRPVACWSICDVRFSGDHVSLARPERGCYLTFAVTLPDARGSGIGVALTDACLAAAAKRDYTTMVTDWRVTNLLASRFWPRRGFRTAFLRLYRSIP